MDGTQTQAQSGKHPGSSVRLQATNICSLRDMDTPFGPRGITGNRQVSLPKELMDRASLQPGDQVHVQWNDAEPGTLLIIPVEIMSEWIRLGRLARSVNGT